jgi:hypothetical protein
MSKNEIAVNDRVTIRFADPAFGDNSREYVTETMLVEETHKDKTTGVLKQATFRADDGFSITLTPKQFTINA